MAFKGKKNQTKTREQIANEIRKGFLGNLGFAKPTKKKKKKVK